MRIGNNVKIQNNVSVYDNVTLEDDVFCGPSMVFTNVYNPRSAVMSQGRVSRYAGPKRGATLGANCTIVCGIVIGEYAFVGAGSVINRDVPAFALMVGVPGRQIGWMSRFGERCHLPLDSGEATCPHTGDRYVLRDGVCRLAARGAMSIVELSNPSPGCAADLAARQTAARRGTCATLFAS